MEKVTKEIFDSIEDNDTITNADVANVLGITVKQLNNYRTGARELTFHSLVKLTQITHPDQAHAKISAWCVDFATTDTISNAFAYATTKRDLPLLANLLNKHRSDAEGKIEQCVKVYDFVLRFMNRDIDKFTMINAIDNIKNIKDSSLILLLDVYRLIARFHQQDFQTIPSIAQELLVRIQELSDKKQGFLKECYLHLVAEIFALTNLHLNNLDQARHFANIVINGAANYRSMADAYYVISMTYLREEPTKAVELMTQSYKFSGLTGDANIERDGLYNLHFAQLMVGLEIPGDADPALIYFAKFRKGEVTYAEAKEVIYANSDLDLIAYFESIAGDIDAMYEGFHEFLADGNMYYAAMIAGEIAKAGEDSAFVRSMTRMCFNKKTKIKGDDLFEETYIRSFNGNYNGGAYHCA